MRFALDLVWLDAGGGVVRVDRAVAPWRVRSCRRAAAVVELPAAGDDEQRDDERDAGEHRAQRPRREREGGGDAERDGTGDRQRGGRQARVLVGDGEVVGEPLGAVALAAARALASAGSDGIRRPAVRAVAQRLLLVERHR
jgi:hypothetical protein